MDDLARLLAALLTALSPVPLTASHAASVSWDSPQQITGDSDVSTAGTLVGAFNFAGMDTTINGVHFETFGLGSTSNTVGNYNLSSTTYAIGTGDTSSTMAPFSDLGSSYQAMLGVAAQLGENQ